MTENNEGLSVWNKILSTLMSMPGIKVNRDAFLFEKLSPYCDAQKRQQAIEINPVKVVEGAILDQIAENVIANHTWKVTGTSAAAGLPGGWTMAATIPADIANYYYHTFVVAQKLAYIYGFPNLIDENGDMNEDAINLLTLFIGVMSGVAVANEGLNFVTRGLAKEVVKRLPKMALTKTTIYPLVKQVGKWIGVSVTRQSFAKSVGKIIPIIGGVISGGLTYATFKPSAKRLQSKLKENSALFKDNQKANSTEPENAQYEVVD